MFGNYGFSAQARDVQSFAGKFAPESHATERSCTVAQIQESGGPVFRSRYLVFIYLIPRAKKAVRISDSGGGASYIRNDLNSLCRAADERHYRLKNRQRSGKIAVPCPEKCSVMRQLRKAFIKATIQPQGESCMLLGNIEGLRVDSQDEQFVLSICTELANLMALRTFPSGHVKLVRFFASTSLLGQYSPAYQCQNIRRMVRIQTGQIESVLVPLLRPIERAILAASAPGKEGTIRLTGCQ